MLIRDARPADLPAIFQLCKEAHASTPYRDVPMNDAMVRQGLAFYIGAPHQFAQVVEIEGRIEGVLIGGVDVNVWGAKQASDQIIYVRDKAKGAGAMLARRFIHWAKKRPGVAIIGLSISYGGHSIRRTARMLEQLGLVNVGSIHLKVLDGKARTSRKETRNV